MDELLSWRFRQNDPHHDGAKGIDVDFRIRWPPPLPWMRWFWHFFVLVLSIAVLVLVLDRSD